MSQKKPKIIAIEFTPQEVKVLEDLLSKKAFMIGGFKKLKKTENNLWHLFNDILKDIKQDPTKISNFSKKKFLH